MASSAGGAAGRTRAKNAAMAAEMKRLGIVRTSARCGGCGSIITIESPKSRYRHVCFTAQR